MDGQIQKLDELANQNKNAGVLLLITNPRSGSTWLLDALRSHPAISMLPEASLFDLLGLSGRRYPRDLSGKELTGPRIAVKPDLDLFEHIPQYSLDSSFNIDPVYQARPYLIEKLHPHFFDFDAARFIDRVDVICSRFPVRIIYQVRDPRASLDSFFRYQQRNPSWYASLTPSRVMDHMKQIYQSIHQLAIDLPGLVLDYQDLTDSFNQTLGLIFQQLWANVVVQDPGTEAIITEIGRITNREKRSQDNKFFSGEKGLASGSRGGFNKLFKLYKHDLEACYSAYYDLLKMRAGVAPNL